MNEQEIKKAVRSGYAKIARSESSCCTPSASCCGNQSQADSTSRRLGYNEADIASVPEGSNLGLGCGNPLAMASLQEGEIVLDLGSGAGFDSFLAAQRVGESGQVIGVDMTPEMVDKARENAEKAGYRNVDFRLGEIESLPVADNSVDIIISNCVINLAPDKPRVFQEAYRVLKPGGRFMISDIVLLEELPAVVKDSIDAYIGCVSGSILKQEYLHAVRSAGFQEVEILEEFHFPVDDLMADPAAKSIRESLKLSEDEIRKIATSIVSVKIAGIKPQESF